MKILLLIFVIILWFWTILPYKFWFWKDWEFIPNKLKDPDEEICGPCKLVLTLFYIGLFSLIYSFHSN